MELKSKTVVCCLIICIVAKQIQSLDSSINQNINQAIKGSVSGSVNQVISQDIKNNAGSSPQGSVNQTINQDIEACSGNAPESINQNIHQKVARGSTFIDQKTVKEIKNDCNSCGNEFIIKRHRSNCGCKDRDSSEEIKVCDGKHTSEIIIKNRETNCKNLSENNSDEITIKYGCDAPRKEERKCEESAEESEEIIVRPKPCGLKSSEELDIKTWIRPCCDCKFKDVSSEETKDVSPEETKNVSPEETKNVSPEERKAAPCPLKVPSAERTSCSSEEHIIADSQDEEDSFESKPKLPPCKCKNRLESSEELFGYIKGKTCSSSGSEESLEIPKPCSKKLKTCPSKKIVVKPSTSEESEDVSGVCDRWSWIRPNPIKPSVSNCGCNRRQPKRKCSSCKQESSIEQQAIFY